MEKQMPESERRERADIIIENNATAKELFAWIDSLLAAL
jgi:dephospho-CoA kinase